MSEAVDNQIKSEVGLDEALGVKGKGSIVEVDPQTGKITVSQKEEKRRKKDIEAEKEHDEICKLWAKDIGVTKEIWFYQCLRNSSSGATQTLVHVEPLGTFFDEDGLVEDIERWFGYRAQGGYAYICQLRINSKVPANQPVRKYYYKEDGEIYKENGGFGEGNNMDDKRSKSSDTEAIFHHVDRTNKMIMDMAENKKESIDPNVVQSLVSAVIAKDAKKDNNDGIVPALMSGFTAIIQAVASKPIEQKNDNTLFLEMFRSVSDGMKEMGRGTNESINKISQMMLDTNRMMLEIQTKSMELRSNDKIETMKMMAEMQEKMLLVVKEMKEKGGDNAGVAGLDHVNKFLDQALKTQGLMSGFNAQLMGGMMNSFKDSVAVMKDLKDLRGDGEAEEKESETVLDKIISKAPEYMEAGAKFIGSMRNSNQFSMNSNIPDNNINEKEKDVASENIQDVPRNDEMTEKELLNDIIEDVMGYLEDKKSHEEIADEVVSLYGGYKDKLTSILNKNKDELMSILNSGNLSSIVKNFGVMKSILGLIKKKLV